MPPSALSLGMIATKYQPGGRWSIRFKSQSTGYALRRDPGLGEGMRHLRDMVYWRDMSKLLQQAIERGRQLPEEEQDMAAAELIGYLAEFPTPEERIAIADGRRAYERDEVVALDQWRHDMDLTDR
jgi:hypothetical protein